MKKIIPLVLTALFVQLAFPVQASEMDALKKELAIQKGQLRKQQELLERLEKRIAEQEGATSSSRTAQLESASSTSSTRSKSAPSNSSSQDSSASSTALTTKGQIGPWTYSKNSPASKMLPDISAIGIFSAAAFEDDPGQNGHNPSRTGFNLQEIEVAIQSVVDSYFKADIFFSFHEEGVELEEAYLTTLGLPTGLQIRTGKMKMPFGRFNQTHLEKWSFVNDPLINNTIFGGEGFNELAFVPSYLFPVPFFLQLEAGLSQGDNENNFDGRRKSDMAYSGRLSTSFDAGDTTFLLGTSFAGGFNSTGEGNATNVFGGDLLLKWRPDPSTGINWQTEYIYRRRQVPADTDTVGGLYTELVGQWSRHWQAGARFDYVGLPQLASGDRQWRFGPMLKFMPSEFFSLRAQYEFEDATNADGNHAGYLQAIFNVGPHGAHQF